jgi:hypothetical protein
VHVVDQTRVYKLIAAGRRLYGKIEQVGGTYIATTFVFLQFLPLFPEKSHIVIGEGSPGTHEVLPIKMNWKSVAAGYLRGWGVGLTLIAFIPALVAAGTSQATLALAGAAGLAICAGLTTAAFKWIGRLSNVEKAHRVIYARFAGHPIDIGLLDEDMRGKIGQRLRDLLEQRASTAAGGGGYRKGSNVNKGYRQLSLESTMRDKDYLEAALTLAHIEASLAVGSARAGAEGVHAAIWNKLVAEHPDVLGVVKEAEVVQSSFLRRALGYVPLVAALGIMGFMLSRNHHVVPPSAKSREEAPREYGFVPAELLR